MRVALAEDSGLVREGLARMLRDAGLEVMGSVASADALLRLVEESVPDVVITDIRMPPTHTTEGLDAANQIRTRHPQIGIVVLSQYVETRHTMALLQAGSGGIGYLLKDRVGNAKEFVEAVRRVAAGETVIDPDVGHRLMDRRRKEDALERLTVREREILALMAQGRSNSAISETLVLSPKTVEGHVARIFMKLGFEPAADDNRRVLAVLEHLRAISAAMP